MKRSLRTRPLLAFGPVLAAAIALAACGGGDNESGGDDFAASAEAICVDYADQSIAAFDEAGELTSAEDAAALGAAQVAVFEEEIAELEALEAPSDQSDQFQELIAKLDEVKQGFKGQEDAGNVDDEQAFQAAAQQTDQATTEADQIAEEMGLEGCAEILPADAEDAVRDVITRTGTTDDPAQCTEDYTARFVEEQFGDVSKCEKSQESSDQEPADSVEIEEVSGYDQVAARAMVTPTGGSLDGQQLAISLRYEDGSWKINSAQPAQPQQ